MKRVRGIQRKNNDASTSSQKQSILFRTLQIALVLKCLLRPQNKNAAYLGVPSVTQRVKDPLPQLQHRSQLQLGCDIWPGGVDRCCGMAICCGCGQKKKKK